jgi:hypothetical protein
MSDRRIWRPKKAANAGDGNLVRLRGESDGLLDGAEVDWDVINGARDPRVGRVQEERV